jgi:hypothetical protein
MHGDDQPRVLDVSKLPGPDGEVRRLVNRVLCEPDRDGG